MSYKSQLLGGLAGLRIPDVAPERDVYVETVDMLYGADNANRHRLVGKRPELGMGYTQTCGKTGGSLYVDGKLLAGIKGDITVTPHIRSVPRD